MFYIVQRVDLFETKILVFHKKACFVLKLVTFFTHLLLIIKRAKKVQKDLEAKFLMDFEKNQNIVHKICRIYTTDRDAHNDLFQEVTIQLWKNYSKFRGDSKFSTWMYRVASKYCNFFISKID